VTARHVVVIGGGLAGISAAIRLREADMGVTLLEARPWLGGATCSFSRGELIVDNGQHVFLRCCTSYRQLLARLGVTGSVALQDRFDVTVLAPGRRARLRRGGLPGPLHLSRALAGYNLLSLSERLRVARAALALRFLDPGKAGVDGRCLGDWLRARGQNERARRRLWDLFVVSSLNIDGDEANLALAATVIKTGLLSAADAADIGVPTVPLGELHGRAAADLLGRLGAQVRLGAKVAALRKIPGGFGLQLGIGDAAPGNGVAAGNGASSVATVANGVDARAIAISADGVVLAVPASQAARLVLAEAVPRGARWAELGSSPIVNVHVVYDRRVTRLPFAAAVDSPVQWVFDKSRQAGLRAGQYLAVSLSAADRYVDVPAARLREQFLPALEQLFPAARDAAVTDFFVTRERRATFRQGPGCGALRPGTATALPGLVLAGAWTDTGWPDTMEGAVRSGQDAAAELIRQLGAPAVAGRPGPAVLAGSEPAGLEVSGYEPAVLAGSEPAGLEVSGYEPAVLAGSEPAGLEVSGSESAAEGLSGPSAAAAQPEAADLEAADLEAAESAGPGLASPGRPQSGASR
jgi:squalene-associated FAD-dependent desaturase